MRTRHTDARLSPRHQSAIPKKQIIKDDRTVMSVVALWVLGAMSSDIRRRQISEYAYEVEGVNLLYMVADATDHSFLCKFSRLSCISPPI